MIVAIGLLSLLVVGIPLVRWLQPNAGGGLLAGQAFLLGSGWCAVALFLLSLAGVAWSPMVITPAVLAPSIAGWFVLARRAGSNATVTTANRPITSESDNTEQTSGPGKSASRMSAPLAVVFDGISVLLLLAYVRFSTIAPLWQWDFWAIWGLKARQFFENGGIDWLFLQNPDNAFNHPDYPFLTTFLFDFFAVMGGRWDDRWIGLLYPAFAIALALIVRHLIHEELGSRVASSLATLGIVGILVNPQIGLADGPFIAFGTAGVLLVRRGWRSGARTGVPSTADLTNHVRRDVWTGAALLGFAAFTKNEGMVLVAATVIASVLTMRGNRRRILDLWPALILLVVWKPMVIARGLRWDYERSDIVSRIFDRLRDPFPIVEALITNMRHPLFALAILAVLSLGFRRIIRRDMFLFLTASILLGTYLAAYFASPNEAVWHIVASWPRIVLHPAALFLYLGVIVLEPITRGES